jgi:hypothetical protein
MERRELVASTVADSQRAFRERAADYEQYLLTVMACGISLTTGDSLLMDVGA